jgi:hypothetical protein
MKLTHPELYKELEGYYGLDLLKWFENDEQPPKGSGAV